MASSTKTQQTSTTGTTPTLQDVITWLEDVCTSKTDAAPLAARALDLLPGLGALCGCGCGSLARPGSTFLPGHDAKLKATLVRAALDGDEEAVAALDARRWSRFLTEAKAKADEQAAKAEQRAKAKAERQEAARAKEAARQKAKAEAEAAKAPAKPAKPKRVVPTTKGTAQTDAEQRNAERKAKQAAAKAAKAA